MPPFSSLVSPLLLIFMTCWGLTRPFTVITSDSPVPSALIDGPQTGFSINNNEAHTDPHEQQAVYDIMRATGNDWATNISDVCRGRWHGIECMPDKDNVYHVVSLSFGALSDDTAFPTCDPPWSYISPSITKLPYIRTLFFYRCLTYNPQPIPKFLGLLGLSLRTLVLRENEHVGPIPSELGNLTHLGVLDLHKNNLNGSIPSSLNRITGLKSLDLSGNRLTGPIPNLILQNLNVLDLSRNLLLGSIPSSLGSCQSLIKIDMGRNRLTGSIPNSINSLKGLILMDLSYNRLTTLPPSLGSLSSLEALILKGNPMGSNTVIPNHFFDGMKGLMILILSNMDLHGSIPESLGRLSNLRVIYLDGNRFNGSVPKNFKELKHVSEMRLNNNLLAGPVPFSREMVWRMRRKLRLYNNSGLCCDSRIGLEHELEIGSCDPTKPDPARTVQHLQTTLNVSSGAVSISVRFVEFSVLFVLALWL